MDTKPRPKILCVDDEANVLEGLSLNLRRRYDVIKALGGVAGLHVLQRDPAIEVVVSDMRMPGMDGATFLSKARQIAPDAVRMLLTGHTDLDSAIAAVNQGQIFRFLTKPCPPVALIIAVEAALEQHRLITAERVLLEQTLHGSIEALTDVLALTNPVSFGRAIRIKHLVSELAKQLEMPERWQVEVAAMLSQLGCITLPAETLEKLYYGRPLSEDEEQMVAHLPAVTEQLLGRIPSSGNRAGDPRLVPPSRKDSSTRQMQRKTLVHRGAQLLKVASDFDVLETQGHDAPAVARYHARTDGVITIRSCCAGSMRFGAPAAKEEVRELSLAALQVGMVMAEDVRMQTGALLVTRGYEVTARFVERISNFRPGTVKEPLVVICPPGDADVTQPQVLFVDDEPSILSSIALTLRGRSFKVVTAGGAAEALDLLARQQVAVVVSDERMPVMGGTALLCEVRRAHPQIVRMVLSGSADPIAISQAVNQAGVFRYLLKPCTPGDLTLAIDQALEASARQHSVPSPRHLDLRLDEAIPQMRMEMQPIYTSRNGGLFAHEALLRLPGRLRASAIDLLEIAEHEGRLWEVERAIRACVAARIPASPSGACVFVNLHPRSLLDPQLYSPSDELAPHAEKIVFEITERDSLLAIAELGPRIDALRQLGYRVAIDDMGSGYSGLNALASILPDFVKFDCELIQSMHKVPVKLKLVSSIAKVCQELSIATIAEGIEDEKDLSAACTIGCTYLQGYMLGRPHADFRHDPFRPHS